MKTFPKPHSRAIPATEPRDRPTRVARTNDTKSPQESMLTLAFLNFAGIADGVTLSLAMTPERLAGTDAAGTAVAFRLEEIRRAMQEAADSAGIAFALEVTPPA